MFFVPLYSLPFFKGLASQTNFLSYKTIIMIETFLSPKEDFSLYDNRFAGIGRLYGQKALLKFKQSHVVIVGLGGVGSWAAEAIVRSGVGTISLIDPDDICVTNTNRQLPAIEGEYGKFKADSLKERLLKINPELNIHVIKEFLGEKNIAEIFKVKPDYVIDGIDSIKHKVSILTYCRDQHIKIVTVGGTAGKWDPTKFRTGDIGESFNDKLIMRVRKKLRAHYDLPPTEKIHYGIDCVYSTEQAVYPDGEGGVCHLTPEAENKRLDCFTGMGSATFVTGSAGFIAASIVLKNLATAPQIH